MGGAGEESEAAKVFDTTMRLSGKLPGMPRGSVKPETEEQTGGRSIRSWRPCSQSAGISGRRTACPPMVFGIEKPVHLKGDFKRETDSINSGVYEEEPLRVTIAPRVRNYKEKAKRSVIADRSKEKQEARDAVLQRERKNRDLLQEYIKDGGLFSRNCLCWSPMCGMYFCFGCLRQLENKSRTAKTEDGRYYTVEEREPGKRCVLQCTDGTFSMPVFTIIFEE